MIIYLIGTIQLITSVIQIIYYDNFEFGIYFLVLGLGSLILGVLIEIRDEIKKS